MSAGIRLLTAIKVGLSRLLGGAVYRFGFEAATDKDVQPMTITRFYINARTFEQAKVIASIMTGVEYVHFEPFSVHLANESDIEMGNKTVPWCLRTKHQLAFQRRVLGLQS